MVGVRETRSGELVITITDGQLVSTAAHCRTIDEAGDLVKEILSRVAAPSILARGPVDPE
jgi:hypothetical protein